MWAVVICYQLWCIVAMLGIIINLLRRILDK